MANKPTKPNFPLGLESQEQSVFQEGILNNGVVEHGPDAVMTVPETPDASGVPSAVRYNEDDDQFEGYYNEGGWLPLGGGNGGRWELLPHAPSSLLQIGRAYLVDNIDGASTVVFPSPKRVGDSITVCDLFGKFSTYPLTVDGNGKSIYGSADSMTISTDNVSATFTWTGEARGWVITSGVGLGQGRVYSREIYSQILSATTPSITLSTQPSIVDVYIDGKRLKESLYTLDGYEVKFDPALASGSDVQIIQYIPIQLGAGGGGSGGTVITWEYNGGSAIGGETQIVLDVVVDSVSEIYIRGQRQQIGRGFTFDPATSTITLADELEAGDDVVVVINGDPTVYNQIDRTPWEVARANNVSNAEVILSTDKTSVLDGKTVLYDVATQTSWGIPSGLPNGSKIYSVLGGTLTYNPGGVQINLVEPPSVTRFLDLLSDNSGSSLIGGLSFLTVEMYSYLVVGNDWRKAIQAAIDKAGQNYVNGNGPTNILIGGHLTVTLNPDSVLIPGEVAAGRGALCMRSGVTLMGGGSITLDGNFTGSSSGAIITNWEGAADNCKIQGITLNGSRGTATGTGITCINIVDSDNVTIDNVKALDSTSGGIYLRRANNSVYGCSNSRIVNCYVHNVGYIGIQCERPNGMTIALNTVRSCGDNGIDIFGNETTETGQGYAERVVIDTNTISDVTVGIFIESCGNVAISSCPISGFTNAGVFFNRINTAAYNCSVIGCTIIGADITASQGIRWKNAVGYTRVYNNTIKNCIDSFVTTGGMIYVDIGVNNHESIGRCLLYVPKTSNGCVYTRMAQQIYNGVQTDGIPYNTTPRGWPSANNTRYYRTSFVAPYMMYSATTGEDNFVRATGTLPSNSGWGPGYAIYNSVVAGETVIAMGSGLLAAGEYMLINGEYYYVFSTASSYSVVRKWDVTSQSFVAGNYVTNLNSAYAYSIYRAAWGTL
ncbi:hypothetical protein RCIP0012_00202 [Klebsiella phage RCIP0012]